MGWLAQKMGWIPEFSKDSFDVLAAGGVDVVKTAKSVNEVQCFKHILHYVQEFGLILFVYTIGIQVGPGFFLPEAVPGAAIIPVTVIPVISPPPDAPLGVSSPTKRYSTSSSMNTVPADAVSVAYCPVLSVIFAVLYPGLLW